MNRDIKTDLDDGLRKQIVWYLFLRVVFISIFLGGTIFFQVRLQFAATEIQLICLYLLFGASYLEALASAAFLATVRRWTQFVLVQLIWDLLFATILIVLTGGVESPFSFLYILVILVASSFFSLREILIVAAVAAILFGCALDLQYYGYWPDFLVSHDRPSVEARQVMFTVFLNLTAFLLSAVLAAAYANRLRKSQQVLEQQLIDFEELERLNLAISAVTSSGLMLVNACGRIRSFNRAAEVITGYSLQQVYDRELKSFFPQLENAVSGEFRAVQRDEISITDSCGSEKILSYATSLVESIADKPGGVLVTFQDLTDFKALEARLKRADRLAAVGRFASGLAHEIRNPLASVSASVQLLMETSSLQEEDRHLMCIVVREADRLEKLLGSFLSIARPPQPVRSSVEIGALVAEVLEVVCRDPRFAQLSIDRFFPAPGNWHADPAQLRQVIWNLLLNAAEAMPNGGQIRIGYDDRKHILFLEDDGPGIPVEIRDKIFDPFFSTKERGSGLGLSIIYTIVEAHEGEIRVCDCPSGGARFELVWPAITSVNHS